MFNNRFISKLTFLTLFIIVTKCAVAAITFSGTTDESKNSSKYSLKNLSHYSHKTFSLSLIKAGLEYNGTHILKTQNYASGAEVNSIMQYKSGNTTYVFPYKFKVHVPKFKTPSPITN
ncbi:MAG: hypothetical protein EO766_06835 [Hydrotalea sp. AMD]|uniref:hypothetical protein n=1 Tax=Hydrotalea sp. AMD TaxID=2501297 RepID=UPI0010270A7A|nr:hypothetical protein [Hydrotalea sp. AMD]RWZ88856.1 MAG: hypothetical protein EO766_06835 [Hydrotalea sp. AMD]